jgi:hypothetical protein
MLSFYILKLLLFRLEDKFDAIYIYGSNMTNQLSNLHMVNIDIRYKFLVIVVLEVYIM